jgi:hypothetical protein
MTLVMNLSPHPPRRLRPARWATFGACAVSAASLCACSASVSVGEHLNNPDEGLSGLLHPTPQSVSCPNDLAAKAGTRFDCTVVAQNGNHVTVGVLEYRKGYVRIASIDGRPVPAPTTSAR